MKRQDLKDRLIEISNQVGDTSYGLHICSDLEDLIERIRDEGLEGGVRESGLKVTLAKGETVVPPDSPSDPLVPSWEKVDPNSVPIGLKPAFPEGPRMEFPITGTDHEIDIASVCVRALDDLPRESRQRVAHYLAGRFGVE